MGENSAQIFNKTGEKHYETGISGYLKTVRNRMRNSAKCHKMAQVGLK